MSVQKDLPELIEAGIISEETADRISSYYAARSSNPQNKLLIVFGILGAILVGLGIILIIAHNWDDLSDAIKLCIAFLPLVTCQALSVFVLLKKQESIAWRESVAVLLFFSVGTAISLVSQVYHISGDLSTFLLTWSLLCLPVVYVLRSSISSLLYIIIITWYAVEGYSIFGSHNDGNYYWLLLLIVLPYYYLLYKQKPASNFMVLHNWIIPISATIALCTVAKGYGEWLFIAYTSLFGLFYIIGNTGFFNKQKAISNSYRVIGSLGTLVILLILSFNSLWENLQREEFTLSSPELFVSLVITIIGAVALFLRTKYSPGSRSKVFEFAFLIFLIIFFIGMSSSVAAVFVNLLLFAAGVLTIIDGIKVNHLGILNYGLLMIAALVVCRFFDTDLSFVVRGILFVLVGSGFFIANYMMLQKRKEHAE